MKTTTLKKLSRGSEKVLEGGTFLLSMVAMVTAVYIYQMVNIGINGETAYVAEGTGGVLDGLPGGGYQEMGLEMVRQTIQSVGSLSVLVGITLIARGEKLGGTLNVTGNALIFTNGFMTGLGFEATTRAIMFGLYLGTLLHYEKNKHQSLADVDRATFKEGLVALSILGAGLLTAGIIVGTNSADIIGMKSPFTDAIQGTLNISAIYLLGRRKTEGQLAFVVSNIFALIMFLIVGQPVMFFSTLSFELTSLLAGIDGESTRAESKLDNFMYIIPVQK